MAENQLPRNNDRIRTEAREADWASLLARAIDDLTRIAHSELRLFVAEAKTVAHDELADIKTVAHAEAAELKTVLHQETDRVLAFIATGVLMMIGAVCILAAAIQFFHEFMMLPWWQSFGIVGLALFAIAIAFAAFASRRTKTPAIT